MRISLVLAVAGLTLLMLTGPALAFSDVPPDHPQGEAIEALASAGVLAGYTDGSFRPGGTIRRAQFAKMAVALLGLPATEHHFCYFQDVEKSGPAGLYPDNYVAVAADSGITVGITASSFGPYKDITRQQVLSMLVRAADAFHPGLLETPPSSWQGLVPAGADPVHGPNVRRAEYNGLLAHLDRPTLTLWAAVSRAEVAQIMANLLPMLPPTLVEPFDVALSLSHTRYLAEQIGVRRGGTEGERRAGDYLANTLREMGYEVSFQTFPLTTGNQSRNVVATLRGTSPDTFVIGGHYDTKSPSPGANDNGTGTGAVLELARILKDEALDFTVAFVFFGTEEIIDGDPNHHHFGSRHYVATLSPQSRALTKAMLSVDMIGYGPEFRVRTMGKGKQSLRDDLLEQAKIRGLGLTYLQDRGATGWSDHEPFELAGIPAAWLEWRDDPQIHTINDIASRVDRRKVKTTGQLVLDYLRGLTLEELNGLAAY